VVDLLSIRGDLDRGRQRLDRLDLATLRQRGIEGSLSSAADSLGDAASRARSSPFLAALAPLPVVGDQVDAIRDLTSAAEDLGDEARLTGRRVADAVTEAGGRPAARIDLLAVVLEELERVEEVAASIDLGAEGNLLPPLRSARADVARSLASVPERLDPLSRQVAALRDLLAGPTSYLVVVGNNAEMRAGAGMPLSAGLATISDGDIELGDFESTVTELYEPDPTGPNNSEVSPTLRRTYSRWNLGRDFPETAVIPHFPITAPIYADLAADTQGWDVDGVLHIDAMALAELLTVVGPVEIDGSTFTSETAPQLVLNQPYLDFGDRSVRDQRLEVQSQLANALFEAIQNRDIELLDVVAALQRAADGRHLMAWSRDPVIEDLFDSFGAAGAIDATETLVSFQNTGANKLDWYIEPTVDATVDGLDTDEWLVTLRASVTNPAGVETSTYIDGIRPELAGGTHRVLVTVQTPAAATDHGIADRVITEFGDDGVSTVIGARFTVPRGETRGVTVRFRLPRSVAALQVAPSARVTPVPWTVNGVRYDDDERFYVGFGTFPEPVDERSVIASWTAVLIALAGLGFLLSSARHDPADPRSVGLGRVDATIGAGLYVVAFVLVTAAVVLA
jgi:hypothetical protein